MKVIDVNFMKVRVFYSLTERYSRSIICPTSLLAISLVDAIAKKQQPPPGNIGQQSKSSFYFSRLASRSSLQVDKQKCQAEWHKLFSSWEHQVLSQYDLDYNILYCIIF